MLQYLPMMWLLIVQIVLALMLTGAILLQGQGSGLGSAFGGSASYHTKRGMEKTLYILTIVLLVVFMLTTILLLTQVI